MRVILIIAIIIGCLAKRESIRTKFDPNNANTKKLYVEMGFDKKEILSKQDFRNFFAKLIYKDAYENSTKKHFYDAILDKYVKDIPESALNTEMMEFLKFEIFVIAIEDTVREQFGERYVSEVTKAMLEMEIEDNDSSSNKENNEEMGKGKEKETTETQEETTEL